MPGAGSRIREPWMIDFSGCRVVITGAAGGVGRALVEEFSGLGAELVACDRDAAGLGELPVAETHAFDLADQAATAEAARAVLGGGTPDVVISNAGWTRAESLAELTEGAFDHEMQGNFRGAVTFSHILLPAMREAGRGSFVFVSSVNALSHFGNPAYAAAKAALLAWMRAIATEEGRNGIRANAVAPGSIRTGAWTDRIARDPTVTDRVRGLYPLGRMVEPAEVARAVVFLASSWSSGITGVTLPVDAGLMNGNLPFFDQIIR